ncbi:hypothetical protein [Listeria newyorkensis]|uniref:Uncharacterized protein n=1 Tax=Listeria newyorkensis TaxID=1497681 RepID=A0A841YZC1_9LIST|nr:hypothetical protein [Listeria newyorkensis]MBC1457896.1 hypothetical protein [Listeria newyorkensis]
MTQSKANIINNFLNMDDRIHNISSRIKENSTELVHLADRTVNVPVVSVPIYSLIYRMNNGRTALDQKAFILENSKFDNFFSQGQESPNLQHYQHAFLLNLANDARGDIFSELKTVGEQRENLISTFDGVIVNGNRRLAAMRELIAQSPSKYSSFNNISIAVLPKDITEQEIELLEAELQLKPNTKLDYDWLAQHIKLRYQTRELNIPYEKIQEVYRYRNISDINKNLEQLALAEEYLANILKDPFNYDEVFDKNQFFIDLQKILRDCDSSETEARKTVAFTLAKHSEKLPGRLYDYNNIFGSDFTSVTDILIEEENICVDTEISPYINTDNQQSDISFFIDTSSAASSNTVVNYENLIDYFNSDDSQEKAVQKITNIFNSQKELQSEKQKGALALKCAENAFRQLSNIDLSLMDISTRDSVFGQLSSIASLTNNLISQLEQKVIK